MYDMKQEYGRAMYTEFPTKLAMICRNNLVYMGRL